MHARPDSTPDTCRAITKDTISEVKPSRSHWISRAEIRSVPTVVAVSVEIAVAGIELGVTKISVPLKQSL